MSEATTPYERERQERSRQLRRLGEAVAAALGDAWRWAEAPDFDHVGHLVDGEGRRVGLYWPPNEPRKVAVSGHYPRHIRLGWGPRDDPRVNVSADRDPAAIASDLQRRFLPTFRPAWDQWAADCADYDARDEQAAILATQLAAAAGGSLRRFHDGHEVHCFRDGLAVTFEVSASGHTRLEVRGMSADLATRVARAIGEEPTP